MKNALLNRIGLMLVFASVFLASCSEDEPPYNPESAVATVEDEFVINASFEDLDNLTIGVMQSSGLGLRTQGTQTICEGAIVNHDLNGKKITVNFGSGCTGPQGVVRKGKLTFSYTGTNFLFPGTSIVTTFEGYEVNGLKIEGTRTLTNTGINLATSTITLGVKIDNAKITWPDNTFVTYNSTQVRQLKLTNTGYESTITGTASGKNRANVAYTATITEDLAIKQACVLSGIYIPIAGTLELTFEGVPITADYGDGACDKVILITYPGGTKEVTVD
ncbi:hypothetical protein D0X99_02150 [Algoriphagus lacus]|uniref:Lipoprotein n=1 Tax=Algoriphagus lacus TaxID=2056311 RepID=A0A418PWH1_9BACT|nr:hypothetical protein [Algoriphagus lacus]RIW18510.1 hypothetical protein D0X99_02150 [Algoriphagus lacus]